MLGLLALGKGPRPDFDESMKTMLPGVPYQFIGALDALDECAIAALAGKGGAYPLRVPACGRSWEIPRDRLLPYIREADAALRSRGTSVTLLMCAGDFPPVIAQGPMLYPGRMVPLWIRAVFGEKTSLHVGIVLPNRDQMDFAVPHWERQGFAVMADWASPSVEGEVARAVQRLSRHADVVVLDCMGFGFRHEQEAGMETDIPVFSALRVSLCMAAPLVLLRCGQGTAL